MNLRAILIGYLCAVLVAAPGSGWAVGTNPFALPKTASDENLVKSGEVNFGDELRGAERGSEYVSGYYRGAVMAPINLWGAVSKPGVHHVPMRTDLLTFLTLAGGPSSDAQLNRVTIKRQGKNNEEVIFVDLEELLGNAGSRGPLLEPNDIVSVAYKKPWISGNTVTVIGVVASLMGIVIGAVTLARTGR